MPIMTWAERDARDGFELATMDFPGLASFHVHRAIEILAREATPRPCSVRV